MSHPTNPFEKAATLAPVEIITTVFAQTRDLSFKWKLCLPRAPVPKELDYSQFKYSVNVDHVDRIEDLQPWLEENVGKLDRDWTYQDSCSVMFRDQAHAVQYQLSFG